MTARPGAIVRYGLMVANSAADPIGPGAEGRLRLEFLNAASVVLSEVVTPLVDAASPQHATAWLLESVTPAAAAWARLSIERFTSNPETDASGSLVADAVFLQVPGHTALPLFTREPARRLVVKDGDPLVLDITVSSLSPLTYQWYHEGKKRHRGGCRLGREAVPGRHPFRGRPQCRRPGDWRDHSSHRTRCRTRLRS